MKKMKQLKSSSKIVVFGKTNSNKYKNAQRANVKPNNYYLLNSDVKDESLDLIYNEDLFQTKFYPVQIKQWAYKLKVGGVLHLKIDFAKKDFSRVLGEIIRWSHHHFDLIKYNEDEEYVEIFLKKKRKNDLKEDINKWTFGIVTLGTKNEVIEKIIKSIRAQKIPEYEIIICGTYYDRKEKDCRYIHFSEHDEKGWTTRKKNIICENAKYPNLVVVHDRILLDKNWFKGMKKFGNNFEILSCKMHHKGERTYDWISTRYKYTDPRSRYYFGGYLEYTDWDEWIYMDGGAIILKKWVWEHTPWPEDRFYAQAEDLKLSHQQSLDGFIASFNPYATWKSLSFNHPFSPFIIKKNDKKLGSFKGNLSVVVAKKTHNLLHSAINATYNKFSIYDPENNFWYRGKRKK